MPTGWEDLELTQLDEGRFTTTISDAWKLAVAPQGGVVAAMAVRGMERVLGQPDQTLRTLTALFAGVVRGGPVEVEVELLRRGRSMSQLTATVRNPGADAGLTRPKRVRGQWSGGSSPAWGSLGLGEPRSPLAPGCLLRSRLW